MKVNFDKFKRSLPYASEVYGVYQPLLGWKSSIMQQQLLVGIQRSVSAALPDASSNLSPRYSIGQPFDPREASFEIEPAVLDAAAKGLLLTEIDSVIARRVSNEIAAADANDPDVWQHFTNASVLRQLLTDSRDEISREYGEAIARAANTPSATRMPGGRFELMAEFVLRNVLERESTIAGLLSQLNEACRPGELKELLQVRRQNPALGNMLDIFRSVNPSADKVAGASLSPIGVVHLFRQYFFEFDTFLGPPVQHVWLSPGGTVELVEISTRRTLVDKTLQQTVDTIEKTDTSTMIQDELSDAVRSENQSSTKLGVSLNSSTGFGNKAIFTSQIDTGTSFSLERGQKEAREHAHKGLRQQTEKLSSEVRRSFKSTFRTVTEITDVTSKRYVIQNNRKELANYELRRKMRQVGVQVQDYGTHLCWQTYIDDPGKELGVARLVHIAEPNDLVDARQPALPPNPQPEIIMPSFTRAGDWPYKDVWKQGFIPYLGKIQIVPPNGYIYSRAQILRISGENWAFEVRPRDAEDKMEDTIGTEYGELKPDVEEIDDGSGGKERSVKTVFIGVSAFGGLDTEDIQTSTVEVWLIYKPSRKHLRDVAAAQAQAIAQASEEKGRVYRETIFKAARERIEHASKVEPRKFEDLRDEERTVVYRQLIRQLLEASGLNEPDRRLRHVFAELVQMMFDIDQMLYFVAPEWWVPRERRRVVRKTIGRVPHQSPQDLGLGSEAQAFSHSTVSWGGATASRPDNYYITKDSVSARFGSSLGWLIQLDGDNLRNAFLNAPWVKAVIPIRAGREWEALEWLKTPNIEGSDGLGHLYRASSNDERQRIRLALKKFFQEDSDLSRRYNSLSDADITILDAIRYLIIRIQEAQAAALTKMKDPSEPGQSYLPTDFVYEHGFDPLDGGFRAEEKEHFQVIDQWIEILPTDQIVPVEVKYNPITGEMLEPDANSK